MLVICYFRFIRVVMVSGYPLSTDDHPVAALLLGLVKRLVGQTIDGFRAVGGRVRCAGHARGHSNGNVYAHCPFQGWSDR